MAETTDVTRLRLKLGESLPADGTEADTLFSEAQLESFIAATGTFDEAVLEAWEAKLAILSNLVNVTDGAASRELSDAFDHANEMIDYYSKKINGRSGRSRVGKIVRS